MTEIKPKDAAQLEKEINEQDAEATRLLESDPTYKKDIKPGAPVEPDRQN